ncbi:MAG: hypothetical protein LUC34_06395 [Campylobacter sp.]|nr:hypothetical protein [Campylobacter sp.]
MRFILFFVTIASFCFSYNGSYLEKNNDTTIILVPKNKDHIRNFRHDRHRDLYKDECYNYFSDRDYRDDYDRYNENPLSRFNTYIIIKESPRKNTREYKRPNYLNDFRSNRGYNPFDTQPNNEILIKVR